MARKRFFIYYVDQRDISVRCACASESDQAARIRHLEADGLAPSKRPVLHRPWQVIEATREADDNSLRHAFRDSMKGTTFARWFRDRP
jgi:hypothetical protein